MDRADGGVGSGMLQLRADSADVHIYRPLPHEVVSPDGAQQTLASEHNSRIAQQAHQQIEFLGLEGDVQVTYPYLPTRHVHSYPTVMKHVNLLRCAIKLNPAQIGPNAGEQLTQVERFGHIVIRANLKAKDPIDVVITSRQHDDRHCAEGADGAAHIKTASSWEHDVEQDEIRLLPSGNGDCRSSIFSDNWSEVFSTQIVREGVAQAAIVLDEQNFRHAVLLPLIVPCLPTQSHRYPSTAILALPTE
jgi:hypothetical protein